MCIRDRVYTTRLSTQSTEALKNVNFAVDNNEYVATVSYTHLCDWDCKT